MATREQLIAIAQRIAEDLPEVSRNEWMRWLQIAAKYGLEKAAQHADRLSQDITMRPAIQRANRLIAQAIRKHMARLENLKPEDRQLALGYVSWHLALRTLRGSWRESEEEG